MIESRSAWPHGTITFLLTDVESSTRLWEQYPAQTRVALARHDALIEQTVAHHRGVVVRPRGEGDSRFAVFGQPADAVNAACEIQLALQHEPSDLPEPLRVRMALHTGEADLRAGDYYGSAVNRCGRLRGLAYGGQIFCSGVTASLTADNLRPNVTLRRLGIYRLRDLTEPEAVFQLVHPDLLADFPPLDEGQSPPVHAPTGFVPAYPFPSPERLVGRDAELKSLSWVLARGQAGTQTLFLGAPAGGGKSTLVGAVARRAIQSGALVLAGGCYESEAVVPLRPFRDALGDYLLSRPADELRAELGEIALELSAIVPELRHHLNLPADGTQGRRIDQVRLFGAIHTCLRIVARKSPVFLCLEDLHVADAVTLDLIQFLMRQVRRLPIVLIGTYRSEEVRPGQALAQLIVGLAREGAEQIELAQLGPADTARLASALLDGPTSEHLNDALYAATEGNPFFLEQLVLTLREERRLERLDGVWQAVGETRSTVPRLVREVVVRRLDRLSRRCQVTLALISVLGQSVDHATLIAASEPEPEAEVLDDLEEALGARVLQETGSGYAFGHALVREAVYWNLSALRRLSLHATAAATLERLAGGRTLDRAAELAHHFARSRQDPSTRAKVMRYSIEAGRKAAAISSHNEALGHYVRACELIETAQPAVDSTTRLEALQGRGQAERNLGRWEDCIASFRDVLQAVTDPVQRARAHGAIGRALEQMGDTGGALVACDAGLAELTAVDGSEAAVARSQLNFERAICFLLKGRFRDVSRLGAEMLEAVALLQEPGLSYRAHTAVAVAHMYQGQFEVALEHHRAALAAAANSGERLLDAVGHENFGAHCFLSGDFDAARIELLEAIRLYHASVSDLRAVLALQILSRVYAAQGELDQAEKTIVQARELAVRGHDRWAAECHTAMGGIHMLRGEWEAAEACFGQALAMYEREGHAVGAVESLIGLGEVRERREDWTAAGEQYRRAYEMADQIDAGPLIVSVQRHLGLFLLRHGDAVEGQTYIGRALSLVESMPASLEYAPTLLAKAELVLSDDAATAIACAEEALRSAKTAEVVAQAHVFLAEAHAALDHDSTSAEHTAAAIGIAERLGSPWLARLTDRVGAPRDPVV